MLRHTQSWDETFQDLYNKLQSIRKDVESAIITRSALGTEDIRTKLNYLVMEMFHTRSKTDEDFEKEVELRGGHEAVLNDNSKINEIIQVMAKKGGVETAKGRAEDKTVEESLLLELRIPLKTQLEQNKKAFHDLLHAATSKIEDAIKHSESRILRYVFTDGAFVRVKDPVRASVTYGFS